MTTLVSVIDSDVQTGTTTIAGSATDSSEVDLESKTLCGVTLDSGFDGTSLAFKAATAFGGTFVTVHDGSADVSLTVAASRYIRLNPADFAGIRYLKFVGASQTGETTITYHYRVV